ncbi:hypothetical protein [uncultured Aquabacterium sp.]|uniref:hypothetical protein n=1 Tax=uncultured Aquabacterium sp. TaxID=158753 RepID=UPI0025E5F75D|nr:hypothetical protein [uncultured Aquabacterium sp.]
MFVTPPAFRQALPHAPIFPPLPAGELPGERPEAPTGSPAPMYCPRRTPRPLSWRASDGAMRLGGTSIGHGPGAGGNDGTAPDRSTGPGGSNLTRQDGGPSGDDIKGPGNSGPDGGPIPGREKDGVLEGTQGGPAQPRRPS